MPFIIGIILLLFFTAFLIYTSISINHAARFRYLGKRTVYLTIFYIAVASSLMAFVLIMYLTLILN